MVAVRPLRSFDSGKRDSYPFTSLNHTHICDAIERSLDNGVTLTFSKLGLSDVGARSAEELAAIERETSEEESAVQRYAFLRAVHNGIIFLGIGD
jgi:hypothetical protein